MSPRTDRIAQLNDQLRTTFRTGMVVITEGIAALEDQLRVEIVSKVQSFSNFGPDNDPYGERDYGSFSVDAVGRVLWKIDYYNRALDGGSEDPSDPRATRRVLTVMLATEY